MSEVLKKYAIERMMWDDENAMVGRSEERIRWHGNFVAVYDALQESERKLSELRSKLSLAPVAPHLFISDYDEWLKSLKVK
jgi:hypothetical protein